MNKFRVKEHFWTQESLVANIDVYWLTPIARLVIKFLELVAQEPVSIFVFFLLVILFEFLSDIFADIAVFFFDSSGNFKSIFTWHGLLTISELLQGKLCDVSSSKRDVLDT